MIILTKYVHHNTKKTMDKIKNGIGNLEWPQNRAKSYNDWMKYISKHISQEERAKILAKSKMLITC